MDPIQNREAYQQECAQGVHLFKETLTAYQTSQIPEQKIKYQDVMEKALQIIHETATRCLSQELQKEESTLEQDYKNYIASPTPENLSKLNQDLDHFQKSV
jgi:uracil DNA glycosylase